MSESALICIAIGIAVGAAFAINMFRGLQNAGEPTAGTWNTISAHEAKKMMDSDEVTVIDVRTEEEFSEEHINGALLLPESEISNLAPEVLPDKSAKILVHCRSGVRSARAAKALAEMGYTSVYDFGGILDWPFETIK